MYESICGEHLDVRKFEHHDARMRTTLTLDDDLALQLKEAARSSGESFKDIVNSALRRGLRQAGKPEPSLPRFVVEPKACGFRAGVDLRKLNQLVDDLEMEDLSQELPKTAARR